MRIPLLTVICIVSCLTFIACDSDKGLNCFQAEGERVNQEFEVEPFTSIVIEERLQLVLMQGAVQKVEIETGENLLNDINLAVQDGVLTVENSNGCNLVRDYNITQVRITSPNIEMIRNASGYEVLSEGTLSYPSLELISEDLAEEDGFHKDGDFRLNLDVENLNIVGNGLSNYFLTGTAREATIKILEGDARFEGRSLQIENLDIFHRGTNAVIVNPQASITGQVLSTGDLIVIQRPPQVDVEVLYTGKLIFED